MVHSKVALESCCTLFQAKSGHLIPLQNQFTNIHRLPRKYGRSELGVWASRSCTERHFHNRRYCCLRRRSYCLPWIASVLEHFHIRTDGRFDWESFKKTVPSRLLGRRIQTQDRSRSMACHYDTLRVHSSHRVQMLTAQHTVSFA